MPPDPVITIKMLKHYPALDGLRGVAVLIVLVAHLTPFYVSGAFGVDVFFVLSGFLITSILASELKQNGDVKIKDFYIKRFLRLLPALWITVCGLLSFLWVSGHLEAVHIREAVYAVTYTSNWVSAFNLDELPYLGHTWSLSIEEQFYIVWPLILVVMFKILAVDARKQTFIRMGIIMLCLAVGCAIYRNLFDFSVMRVYRGLDTHFDGLMIGASLGCFHLVGGTQRLAQFGKFLAPVALAIILIMPMRYGWGDPFTVKFGYLIIALAAAILIMHLTISDSDWLSRLLSLAPLRYCGKISYGLYLYHWPINRAFAQDFLQMEAGWVRLIVVLALSFIISDLSYRLIEVRFLRMKKKFTSDS